MACRECGYNDCLCSTIKVPYTEQINQLRTRITELEIALKLAQADKVTLIAERDRYMKLLSEVYDQMTETGQHDELYFDIEGELKEGQDD